MREYDILLQKAKEQAEQFRLTAKDFVPKMYEALRNENPNISPEDVRDRIEKDCIAIWSKRTILNALPHEAKNQEKRKAGRLSRKEQNSAALVAAPLKRKVMMTSTQGAIEQEEREALNHSETDNMNNLYHGYRQHIRSAFQEEEQEIKKQDTVDTHGCHECQQLRIKVVDLEEALEHVPFLAADQIGKSTFKYQIPKERHPILDEAMRRCSRVYQVTFDSLGNLISAEPDVS